MIHLLFVGDGERDAATNPHLVATIVETEVEPATTSWARLNAAGKGHDRKLLFAIRDARDNGLEGVVATIDQDKSPGRERLKSMRAARTKDRETPPPLPTALGCADPHAEAWLLDDAVAVRTVLQLEPVSVIPNVRKVACESQERNHWAAHDESEVGSAHPHHPGGDRPGLGAGPLPARWRHGLRALLKGSRRRDRPTRPQILTLAPGLRTRMAAASQQRA